jgi:6-phosphofructokinase 2
MKIVTLTINPALDKSSIVAGIAPEKKLRCLPPVYEPGGGGINVSRAIRKLGGESVALFTSGGSAGEMLHQLLEAEGVPHHTVSTRNWTRENFIVVDSLTNQQYRFGMPGALVEEDEWENCLETLETLARDAEFVVASGSLPEGVPADFYTRVATIAKAQDARCVLDTSGEALLLAAEEGVFMLKPNLGELSALAGKPSITAMEQEQLAQSLIGQGKAEVIVVSLGKQGAMLATKDLIEYVQAPTVHSQSTVGAGDSMVAGMVLALAQGKSYSEMVRYGVAAGTAATMNSGTQLCKKTDVETLYNWISSRQ